VGKETNHKNSHGKNQHKNMPKKFLKLKCREKINNIDRTEYQTMAEQF
jgi:hypothetical protein